MHKLDFAWSICYIQLRQKEKIREFQQERRKPPEAQSLGVLYSVFYGWIKPEAGYRLFVDV